MNSIDNRGDINIKILLAVILASFFVLSLISVYFGISSSTALSKVKELQANNQKLSANFSKINNDNLQLQNKLNSLEGDYKVVAQSRDNLSAQVEKLLQERKKTGEIEENLIVAQNEVEAAQKEKDKIAAKVVELEQKISEIKKEGERVLKEKEALENEILKEQDRSGKRELIKEKRELEKETKSLAGELREKQAEAEKLKKSEKKLKEEVEKLEKIAEKANKDYAKAVVVNKRLQNEIVDTPGKFTELARQNKSLIRDMSNTHYNLGVFYTKNKEYFRAIAEYEKAIELAPDDAYAHFNLGYIYAEYIVNRTKAIEHFRHYLRLAKSGDKDADWARKYILTWQTYESKNPMK